MTGNWTLQATGFGLIAVSYGLARFSYGLLLPQINHELHLTSAIAGLISGSSFLAYCLALMLAAVLTERVGARAVASGAALMAALGLAGMALAPTACWLALSVMAAGLSTGLASPALAAAVSSAVRADQQNVANTVINAGTGAGVALAGLLALSMGGHWRLSFALYAVLALLMAIATLLCVPRGAGLGPVRHAAPRFCASLARPASAAFLTGVASTAIWSFGSELGPTRLGWGSAGASLLWMSIGAAGIAGASAGALLSRWGVDRLHWRALGTLSGGMLLIGFAPSGATLVLIGGALFGSAYIALTGLYLVWAIAILPARPAAALMVCFLGLAIGQTVGAPIVGLILGGFGPQAALIAATAAALSAGFIGAGRQVSKRL